MCAVCKMTPCHPSCPNAPEPRAFMRCIECGEGIYADDKYFDAGIGGICEECMENKKISEILELLGEQFSVAL